MSPFYQMKIGPNVRIGCLKSLTVRSKSEGLKYFISPSSRSRYLFSTYSRSNIYFKNLPSPPPPPSKSNGRPLDQHFIWLYSLSVQRGRIEYEGETSVTVYTQISPPKNQVGKMSIY